MARPIGRPIGSRIGSHLVQAIRENLMGGLLEADLRLVNINLMVSLVSVERQATMAATVYELDIRVFQTGLQDPDEHGWTTSVAVSDLGALHAKDTHHHLVEFLASGIAGKVPDEVFEYDPRIGTTYHFFRGSCRTTEWLSPLWGDMGTTGPYTHPCPWCSQTEPRSPLAPAPWVWGGKSLGWAHMTCMEASGCLHYMKPLTRPVAISRQASR